MRKRKKIVLWIMGSLLVVVLLAGGFVLLLPRLIDMEPIKERILTKLSQEVGGQVTYESFDLSYFPQPYVVIHQASLSVPGIVAGKLESVEIYPALSALFRGKLHISTILMSSPDFSINIQGAPKKTGEARAPRPLEETGRILSEISAVIASNFPDLTVIIEDGRFDLQRKSKPFLSFSGVNGRLTGPPGNFRVDMTCGSNLWEKVSMKAEINPADFRGGGHIDLENFRPHRLVSDLAPDAPLEITDSQMDARIGFKVDGTDSLQAEIEGSIPSIHFHEGTKDVVIKGKELKGGFQMKGERIDISLDKLNLEYPRLTLSGRFKIDQKAPHLLLEVQGRQVDVASTRDVTLMLAGKIPVMNTIFDIVREGRIPLINFQSYGRRIAELDDTEHLSIKGNMLDGEISLPIEESGGDKEHFTLVKVAGDVVVSRGILEGKNLRAQWKNQQLQEGSGRVGLEGKDVPLHAEVIAEMDLPSLPPLLGRLIKEEELLRELSRIHDLKGRALGKIVLGESTASLKAKVQISEMNLMARYDPIPYPVEIEQGQFSFDGESIGLKSLSGKVGRSTFSGLTANLDVGKKQDLEVLSGNLSLVLGELYPWLSSAEAVKNALRDFPSLKGEVQLNTVKLAGLISSPGDWRFETAGELREVEAEARFLPGPITVSSGKFRATQNKFSFDNLQARLLDASFNLNGSLDRYLQGIEKADLNIRGSMTPKDIHQLSNLFGLKSNIPLRSRLFISEGHLSWAKAGDTSFKGNIAIKEGPQIYLDLFRRADRLKVNGLQVSDGPSRADMTLELQGKMLEVTFSGELSERTLDKIFEGYQFQEGWVQGDFRVNIDLDQPLQSSVQGKIKAHDLSFPWQFKQPLEVSEISLDAQKNRVSVELASFTWAEKRFVLSGDVNFSKERVKLDLNLSTGKIDLQELQEVFGGGEKRTEKRPTPPVEGIIRLKCESLEFKEYTWIPFIADISFGNGGVEVNVKKANLCGVDMPGVVKVSNNYVSLNFEPSFKGHEIESAFHCLLNQDVRATGSFELYGKILAQGKPEDLSKAVQGNIEFHAKDGRIYYAAGLVRILEFLNVTEIYRGKVPDLKKEGLPYDRITMRGTLREGKFAIKEGTLDGPTMEMAAQGEMDLSQRTVKMNVLIAPLKTVDRIIKVIPLVNTIFAGTLVTIPVKVQGDLKDPKVTALSPSAVGAELFAIMKRTLGLPFKVIEPLISRSQQEK
jgi:hypothetical protein